jgi:hypothetical protein
MCVRKICLFLVMVGAMAQSFHAQVETLKGAMGQGMGVVFALTMDIASLLALHELMTATRREVRGWAWAVLLVAGGTSLSLTTRYVVRTDSLPVPLAFVVGIVPVVLAGVLSHLLALSMEQDRAPESVAAKPAEVPAPRPKPRRPDAAEPSRSERKDGKDAAGSTPGTKAGESGEVTEDLLRRAAELEVTNSRRAGYRTLKDGLEISEPLARTLRAELDKRQAGAQVIPMHRSGDARAEREDGDKATGWRSAGEDPGRHSEPSEEVAR